LSYLSQETAGTTIASSAINLEQKQTTPSQAWHGLFEGIIQILELVVEEAEGRETCINICTRREQERPQTEVAFI